jgi:predicted Zn finger-like uncharacterized protein
MHFVCEQCQTRYVVADEKVRQRILKIRCKTCQGTINIREPNAVAAGQRVTAPVVAVQAMAMGHSQSGLRVTAPVVAVQAMAMGQSQAGFRPSVMRPAVSLAPQLPPPVPPPPPAMRAIAKTPGWFMAVNRQQFGPIPQIEVARKVLNAREDDELLIWREGLGEWKDPKLVEEIQADVASLRRSLTPLPALAPSRPPPMPPPRPSMAISVVAPAAEPGADDTQNILLSDLEPLFPALPPAPLAPAGIAVVRPIRPTGRVTRSTLSELTQLALPALTRRPALRFLMAGVVVVVLVGLAVLVLSTYPTKKKSDQALVVVRAETRRDPSDFEEPIQKRAPGIHANLRASAPLGEEPATRGVRPRITRLAQAPSAKPTGLLPSGTRLEPEAFQPAAALGPASTRNPRNPWRGLQGGLSERVVEALPASQATRRPDVNIPPSKIAAVVQQRETQNAIKQCHERGMKSGGMARSGRIDVSVQVGTSGLARSVDIQSSRFAGIAPCLQKAIQQWRFPRGGDAYAIEFPLILQGSH